MSDFCAGNLGSLSNYQETVPVADQAKEVSIDVVAGETISALKAVYLDPDGFAFLGDYFTKMKAQVIGISKTAGDAGDTIKVLIFGRLDDGIFTYLPGESLYLTTMGNYSTIAPTNPPANYLKEVGQGLQTGSIFVNMKEVKTLIP